MHLSSLLGILSLFVSVSADCEIVLVHTNDCHARIQQTNTQGGLCTEDDAKNHKCFGGVARRSTVLKDIRSKHKNVLLLDSGDHMGIDASHFMNKLGYDAMSFGDYEFEDGIEGIIPFLKDIKFPLLCSNIDSSKEPRWNEVKHLVKKSTVIKLKSRKVGVIGYITPDVKCLARVGNLNFLPVVESVRAEAKALKASGIDIIFAVGYAGLETDMSLAREVPELDVVVGGHTATFLYNGYPPSIEEVDGPYPLVINPTENPKKKILVVQDYTFGKYLGYLKIKFGVDGEVRSFEGNPILLDKTYPESPEILADVNQRVKQGYSKAGAVLGYTKVLLDGAAKSCRLQECNLGNVIADAAAESMLKCQNEKDWSGVGLAVWNSGGIRSSIVKAKDEPIRTDDVLGVLPFSNTVDFITITGTHLLEQFEHSVDTYSTQDPDGRFLQVSGFKVQYDLSKPVGSRVRELLVRCTKSQIPIYKPIKKDAIYKVIISDYLYDGGDNYQFKKYALSHTIGSSIVNVVKDYIRKYSPIEIRNDSRITFYDTAKKTVSCSSSLSPTTVKPPTTTVKPPTTTVKPPTTTVKPPTTTAFPAPVPQPDNKIVLNSLFSR